MTIFPTCFSRYTAGHYLDDKGYQATYYDENSATSNLYSYTYQVPTTATNLKPIYFSVSSYDSIIPDSCFSTGYSYSFVYLKVYS
jgi:hypothetical protein